MVRQASGTTAQPNGRTPTKEHKPSTSLPLTDRHSPPAHVPRGSQHRHGRKVAPLHGRHRSVGKQEEKSRSVTKPPSPRYILQNNARSTLLAASPPFLGMCCGPSSEGAE